ncbi:TPA: UTP--glucose-1-phosphate uridylyltransferase, partial [Streptococcus equi subsp. zooepidemicus]|nr:UTP--glucose-1-phosphate uridylyltransferase [Streptococcus equi subsp. zooepidemicus]HEL0525225.1 UTP--glucose-1-phosphate uridylyltransferase [Streptococcus equi subsp. zooepidemicus]HEL0548014.1 UTP--glucose-1-phosphate uridylyltransferase [Streptococcus equi subsp. zooepidemicus]
TSLDYALKHPQVKDDLTDYIIKLSKQLNKDVKK